MEIVERKEFNGIRINEEQISEFNVGINPKNHTGLFVMARLVDCNRYCNIIDIHMALLFGCLVMFLL